MNEKLNPPKAKKHPRITKIHGITLRDDYSWLREKKNPQVINYLKKENKYTEKLMSHNKQLQKKLFKEMKKRIKETDTSAPVKIDNFYYYTRTVKEKQYPFYCRKKESMRNKEEILLDLNRFSKGKNYLKLGVYKISPDHSKLAYSLDFNGSERYTIYIKNLKTKKLLKNTIKETDYSLEWMNNKYFLYTLLNKTGRPYKVYKHKLGESPKKDKLMYHEKDERFYIHLKKSRSKRFIFMECWSSITSEVRFLEANDLNAEFQIINSREQKHEYSVDHGRDGFFIWTNYNAKNFRLMKTPINKPSKNNWKEVIAHRKNIMLEGFDVFEDYLATYELSDGITNLKIINLDNKKSHYIRFDEEIYAIIKDMNSGFKTSKLRFLYSSLVTPEQTIDYDMRTKKKKIVKKEKILGYDPSLYSVKREYAIAKDGMKIPISLAYKKGVKKDGKNPLLLVGYGSYGVTYKSFFTSPVISLLNRGFVLATAHIRGGGAKGREWYEGGKFLKKKNTFNDFISCAKYLIKKKYTSKNKIVILGGSAGGLLISSVINMEPKLFKAAILSVPFVDILNTMLDPSIPLTVREYEEWGDPKDKKYFKYIRSYAPYENVSGKDYPRMLVTAGLNDPRVHYWEPAKFVAKLRELKTDNNLLLLKTQMGGGHMGRTGRYDWLKEVAFEYAFILDSVKIKK